MDYDISRFEDFYFATDWSVGGCEIENSSGCHMPSSIVQGVQGSMSV